MSYWPKTEWNPVFTERILSVWLEHAESAESTLIPLRNVGTRRRAEEPGAHYGSLWCNRRRVEPDGRTGGVRVDGLPEEEQGARVAHGRRKPSRTCRFVPRGVRFLRHVIQT